MFELSTPLQTKKDSRASILCYLFRLGALRVEDVTATLDCQANTLDEGCRQTDEYPEGYRYASIHDSGGRIIGNE